MITQSHPFLFYYSFLISKEKVKTRTKTFNSVYQGIRNHTLYTEKGALRGRATSQQVIHLNQNFKNSKTCQIHDILSKIISSNSTVARLSLSLWPLLVLRGPAVRAVRACSPASISPKAVRCGNLLRSAALSRAS